MFSCPQRRAVEQVQALYGAVVLAPLVTVRDVPMRRVVLHAGPVAPVVHRVRVVRDRERCVLSGLHGVEKRAVVEVVLDVARRRTSAVGAGLVHVWRVAEEQDAGSIESGNQVARVPVGDLHPLEASSGDGEQLGHVRPPARLVGLLPRAPGLAVRPAGATRDNGHLHPDEERPCTRDRHLAGWALARVTELAVRVRGGGHHVDQLGGQCRVTQHLPEVDDLAVGVVQRLERHGWLDGHDRSRPSEHLDEVIVLRQALDDPRSHANLRTPVAERRSQLHRCNPRR